MASKTTAEKPKTSRSKKAAAPAAEPAANGNVIKAQNIASASFVVPEEAFTVELPDDPGPTNKRFTLREDPGRPQPARSDRAAEGVVQVVHLRRADGRVQFDLADQGLHGQPRARVRRPQPRRAEVLGRGVPRTRHDLQRAAARARPSYHGGVGRNQGYPRPGNLHGRLPAHDRQGHVHDQRRGARDREPARPFAGRVLLAGRRHQQPADVQRDDHPQPRCLDRVRNRQRNEERRDRGHDRRPHRQEPQDLRDDVHPRAVASRPRFQLGER